MADLKGYPQLQARLQAIAGKGDRGLMAQLALRVVREAKLTVPRKTSNLGRSIRLLNQTAITATVAATAAYAAYVEFGTRPHRIPKTGSTLLAWPASGAGRRLSGSARKAMYTKAGAAKAGGWAYAMHVNHPGTRPHPFLIPAARKVVREVGPGIIVNVWNDAA